MVRMSIDKYRLWFKRSKYSSQDLRNAKIRHLPLQLFSLKLKARGFVIICKELAFDSFLSIRPILLILVIVLIKNIYICYVLIHLRSKLWFNSFIQWARSSLRTHSFSLQIFDFISSLKQNSQPELSLFCAFSFKVVHHCFIWISFDRNSSKFMSLHQNAHFQLLVNWWLLLLLYLNILPVSLLFIQESFQVLESVVQKNKKIQIQGVNACLLFFFTGYQKSLAVGIRATWQFLHSSYVNPKLW